MVKKYLGIGAILCICAAAWAEGRQKVVPADGRVTSTNPYALQQRLEPFAGIEMKADESQPAATRTLRLPLEDCGPGSIWSQPVEEESWGYAVSEVDVQVFGGTTNAIFDEFGCFFNNDPNSTFTWSGGTINSLRFWGVEVTYDGAFSQLLDPNIKFDITILTWEFGLWAVPEICFYDNVAPAQRVDTTVRIGTNDDTILWRYEVNLPTPCVVNQPRAWIVIQGANEGDLSYFGWARSQTGTNRALSVDDTSIGLYDDASGFSNFAFCLNGTASVGVTGACCNERTGACTTGTPLEDCCTYWARFVPNGTCGDIGNCGAMQGACCDFPVNGCTVTTRANCEANNGRWLGEGSDCTGGPCCFLSGCDTSTEGEAPRFDQDTPDTFNGGCNTDPNNPPVISVNCGDFYCGTTGTYWSLDAQTKFRDLDYYELDLTGATAPTAIQITAAAEMPVSIFILASGPGGTCAGSRIEATFTSNECNTLFEGQYCAASGRKYWIVPTVTNFALEELEIAPNSSYFLQIDCGSCTLEPGACCIDNECTSPIGELECLALGGEFYRGADCATFDCPCLPEQVIWTNGLPSGGWLIPSQRWDLGTPGTTDDQWIWTVDDVTFASNATMTGAYFWMGDAKGNPPTGPLYDGRSDYIILRADGANGAPNTVVAEVFDVPTPQHNNGESASGNYFINLYVMTGLNVNLPAGDYYFGFRPVTPGSFDGRQAWCWPADDNGTGVPYMKANVFGDPWANWGPRNDLNPAPQAYAFCLIGSMAPPAEGACCLSDGQCIIETQAGCEAIPGATYQGNGTSCDPNPCAPLGCPGDYDCDGDIDFFDIDLLLAALGGESAWATKYQQKFGTAPPCGYLANCDADQNGSVDFFDIDAFLDLLGTDCP